MTATTATLTRLRAWRPGGYLRASGVLFGWLALRTVAQMALFVLVARTLGAEGYGSLIAVMAIATLFAPLAGLGGQALLVRDGARNPEHLATHLGDALRLWAISVVPLSVAAFVACRLLVPPALPAYAVAAIVLADLAGASLLELMARTWQAHQRMAGFGAVMSGLILTRLAAFLMLTTLTVPNPAQWAVLYGAVSLGYTALATWAAAMTFGRPVWSGDNLSALVRAGFPFAFAGGAMRVQAEANKPILARLDTLAGVGAFSAAQRVMDVVLLPVTAALDTLLPRAYRAQRPLYTVLRIGTGPLVLSIAGGGLLALSAPLLPALLGPSFAGIESLVRAFALLPAAFVVRSLLTFALAARGGERHFLLTYTVGALTSVVATAAWVPSLGLTGAIAAAYATELSLIAVQGGLLVRRR
ncbi:MAG: oligosaccharide flippase family protein [Immundisolibacter sp.]|uniref:lipopolysaccharide biosynthesis protein n=1 Tax=Immundisolibacter sp. TaxID=1934948 RepID=UPI0019CD0B83|nr:oligosaccharide flippase family protein [Immundisolibacter sp.]MBC7162268.1 oligosaccharide flippase family protein [Immundisolibacter sp.]